MPKNAINPHFKFIPGIYLPSGLSDFEIKQNCQCVQGETLTLAASVNYTDTVEQAYFDLITQVYGGSAYFVEQLFINEASVFTRTLSNLASSTNNYAIAQKTINISNTNFSELPITYQLSKSGYVCYLDLKILPRLFINGQEIDLSWSAKRDTCYKVKRYQEWIKQYYNLVDGVIFFSNR